MDPDPIAPRVWNSQSTVAEGPLNGALSYLSYIQGCGEAQTAVLVKSVKTALCM